MSLKVCIVSSLYHPNLGGLGRQAQLLSERLKQEGVDLFVIARKMGFAEVATFSPGVEVIRVPSLSPKKHILEEVSLQNILISLLFSVGCLVVLLRRRNDYDIVHFHGASIPLFVCLPFLKFMEKKVVAKVAAAKLGTEAGSLRGRYGLLGNLLALQMKQVDSFIAISKEIRQDLIRDGIPEGRVTSIRNFVDAGQFFPPGVDDRNRRKELLALPPGPMVCSAGRFVERKGIEYLLQAWKEVQKRFPSAFLLILGEGPLEDTLKKMAGKLSLGDSVRFGGRVANVPDYLRASDLFVLPSLQEGLPNSLLEAMACGLPSVATRIGGVLDLVEDSISGVLVDPGDPESLAEGLMKLLSDESLRETTGRGALRAIQERFTLEAIFPKYMALYRRLLS